MRRKIESRIRKLENKLVPQEQTEFIVVKFGGELPPDRTEEGIAYRFVHHEARFPTTKSNDNQRNPEE